MAETEMKVQFPEEKLDALRFFAERDGATIEGELKDYLEKFYQKNVPEKVREYVEHRGDPKANRQESTSSQASEQDRQTRQYHRHQREQLALEAPAAPEAAQQGEASESKSQGMSMGGM